MLTEFEKRIVSLIHAVRESDGIVNRQIVAVLANGIVSYQNRGFLRENGKFAADET